MICNFVIFSILVGCVQGFTPANMTMYPNWVTGVTHLENHSVDASNNNEIPNNHDQYVTDLNYLNLRVPFGDIALNNTSTDHSDLTFTFKFNTDGENCEYSVFNFSPALSGILLFTSTGVYDDLRVGEFNMVYGCDSLYVKTVFSLPPGLTEWRNVTWIISQIETDPFFLGTEWYTNPAWNTIVWDTDELHITDLVGDREWEKRGVGLQSIDLGWRDWTFQDDEMWRDITSVDYPFTEENYMMKKAWIDMGLDPSVIEFTSSGKMELSSNFTASTHVLTPGSHTSPALPVLLLVLATLMTHCVLT